ncbi:MAG TPA: START domain-containing protein [Syntrophorhabdaceae bacterium]|nr:START domain-containing protein [Syntrophorhabdaceae bacterium]HPA07235.1 START domain-containing protein [Methanoregulaceae archaeon]
MKCIKISIQALLIVLVCFTLASASDCGWKKIGELNGIVGYTRSRPGTNVHEVKGVGIVDAPISVVHAVIHDVPAQPDFMFMCKEAAFVDTPEFKHVGDIYYLHNVTGMPFPVEDRDVVIRGVWSIDKVTGTLYLHCDGLKTTYLQKKDVYRMPLLTVDYILAPKSPDKTEVTYTIMADPGGNVPAFLVNLFTRNAGIKTIEGIRKMVLKEKYKNANAVIITTPHI